MDEVTRQCPQITTFLGRERRAETVSNRGPSTYQPNALPLGRTGSLIIILFQLIFGCVCAGASYVGGYERNP